MVLKMLVVIWIRLLVSVLFLWCFCGVGWVVMVVLCGWW